MNYTSNVYEFPSPSTANTRNRRWRTASTATNASTDSTVLMMDNPNYPYYQQQGGYQQQASGMSLERERERPGSLRRLRRISGIFEQTAQDVQDRARDVVSSVIIPATDSSRQYARDQPMKATFFAMVTFFSFLPVLLFIVFSIAAVVFTTFTSVSFAITSTALAFILGGLSRFRLPSSVFLLIRPTAVTLAASILLCVAPASILATSLAFLVLGGINVLRRVVAYIRG